MAIRNEAISFDDAKDALSRSGYLLESRLDACLRGHHYDVATNVVFPDPLTAKSREMDLYASTRRELSTQFCLDEIANVLLIECVNNPQPIAFLTDAPGRSLLPLLAATVPADIPGANGRMAVPAFLGLERYHHYCSTPVATQFCSFVRKGRTREWMATHDEG